LGAFPRKAIEQSPQKIARLGYLDSSSSEGRPGMFAVFRQGLQELGYADGKNIAIEEKYAGGRYEKRPEMAAELVRLKVDTIAGEAMQLSVRFIMSGGIRPAD